MTYMISLWYKHLGLQFTCLYSLDIEHYKSVVCEICDNRINHVYNQSILQLYPYHIIVKDPAVLQNIPLPHTSFAARPLNLNCNRLVYFKERF